jgi:hypothetical protein
MTNKTTTVVQIGNTDNKLTQQEWSRFLRDVDNAVVKNAEQVYFSGTSSPYAEWQNAAWIFHVTESASLYLYNCLKVLREKYDQDSIAWSEGQGIFIESPNRL